ncbi:predicted protein [Naegleria gruberi]|uniref:Predicted protein n=1 Tax=Naegleria gruberi TaxID=5762 RepID=D2V2D5_NAEGR|nr:uncharacterized protein NAEGRDRAFT_62965 [Naegleria gruberi]EFC49038.1 predicted protein [Naegleria gruberi]|eukprot:XP_002681782.1 predicted protein [Naegleria gruberi strain NEG-M]
MSENDNWLDDLSNSIVNNNKKSSEGNNEYLFNRILQSSIKQELSEENDESTSIGNQIPNQILIKTCPYLFSLTSSQGDSPSVHPKFKKLYQKLTRYISRKLEKKSGMEEIENHIRKMMDNLMWNNGEVVDFFHDQDEWLQSNTQYSSWKNTQMTSSKSSSGRIENQNMDLIWEQLKTEVFEILLNVMGETSITLYEFKHALRTALYQLQLKEREYRRIPKELLEIAIDKFLPNAQNGRSLVQFIVSELKRLKSETENISSELSNIHSRHGNQSSAVQQSGESTSKRALKIISMTIMQLLQRRLIPIPGIQMLDDESVNNIIDKTEKPIKQRDSKRVHYKGIVDFSKKVYLNYLQNKNRNNERKKDFSISMDDTQLQSNNNNSLSYWNNNTFSSRINSMGRSSNMSREIDNWMNQYRDIRSKKDHTEKGRTDQAKGERVTVPTQTS